jgi:hypothetical protein
MQHLVKKISLTIGEIIQIAHKKSKLSGKKIWFLILNRYFCIESNRSLRKH